MMIETIATLFGILVGAAGLYYGHRAHHSSIQAPILKLAFCHPNTRRPMPIPRDPRQPTKFQASPVDHLVKKKEVKEGQAVGFHIPFIIRNVGTRTARQVRIHARYSPAFVVLTNGTQIEDSDRPNWLVTEHNIADLHPQQSYTFEGDFIAPPDETVHGFEFNIPVKFRDNVPGSVEVKVKISAVIEIVVFADDLEPIFRRAIFESKEQNA